MSKAMIRTNHGTYTGRDVESIVRREYGRKAWIWWSADSNDVKVGTICGPRYKNVGSYPILATLWECKGAAPSVDEMHK